MTSIAAIGTYLPPWAAGGGRTPGPDEDAVTMAVAAGRAAVGDRTPPVQRVVLVTRDLPLLDGGNSAVLLAGIGLGEDTSIVEQSGGAADALAALADATPATLVIGADLAPAGAAAVLIGEGDGLRVGPRVTRSLPVRSRTADGVVHDYADPRLLRERGTTPALERLGLHAKPDVIAGLPAKQAAAYSAGKPAALPTLGASSALFAVAVAAGRSAPAVIAAVEQASASSITVEAVPAAHRDERPVQPDPGLTDTPGPEIPISLPAYERAFESKLRWEAGRCNACGHLALPPRLRCTECGSEAGWSLTPLPRRGEVYTDATIRIPVPGLPTPYTLALVQLDDVPVRALVKVTGVPAGTAQIGDRGELVLRRVAMRSGVPDYGYALLPDLEVAP